MSSLEERTKHYLCIDHCEGKCKYKDSKYCIICGNYYCSIFDSCPVPRCIIYRLQWEIEMLKRHIRYSPGGEGELEALVSFLEQQKQRGNYIINDVEDDVEEDDSQS